MNYMYSVIINISCFYGDGSLFIILISQEIKTFLRDYLEVTMIDGYSLVGYGGLVGGHTQ